MTANSTPQLAGITKKALRQHVADVLREAILTGEFKPGQAMTETELAAQLGVSRAPLREAFQQLAAEGLVENVAYHGTTVKSLTRTDIEELYSLRAALEVFAIERIIAQPEELELSELEAIYADMIEAAQSGDIKQLSIEDQRFHTTLILMSGHGLLHTIWIGVSSRVRHIMALRNRLNRDLMQVARNHIPIIEALKAKDAPLATRLIQQHVASAGDLVLHDWAVAEASLKDGAS